MTARAWPCPPLSAAHNERVQAPTLRPLRRWLAPDRPPSRRTRVTLEIVILAALAMTDSATGSETVVMLVLLGLLLVVVPMASRVLDEDEPDPFSQALRGRRPARAGSTSFLTLLVLMAVESFVPDLGLGPTFWLTALLAVSIELDDLATRRTFRLGATDRWQQPVPLAHSALAGAVTVALVFVTALLFGDRGVPEASAWAFGSSLVVFALGALVTVAVPAIARSVSESQT